MNRLFKCIVFSLAFMALLWSMSCRREGLSVVSSPPNLVLITLDTTRADHLGCYGYKKGETPNIDRMASQGILFEQAMAVAPLTLPSHASLLTGLYPPRHGVRDNADFRLPESETTLAEHLKKHGFATAAVVGSLILAADLGLKQGFDMYDQPPPEHHDAPGGEDVLYSQIVERPASAVTQAALAIIEKSQKHPFFLWIHYYDPHNEYNPPEPYSKRFAGNLYDGEIAFMDAQLGRVLADLTNRGLLDNTLIAIVADHGESLGDHGEDTHALFLYESAVHIPLILRYPKKIPASMRTDALISQVDLVPTLLDLMDLPPMGEIHGKSFAQVISGAKKSVRDAAYIETVYPERAYGWSSIFAMRSAGMKYIDAPESELYDLSLDAAELNNRAPSSAGEVASWKSRLINILHEMGNADASAQYPFEPARRESLRSLGYVSSGISATHPGSRRDPKRYIHLHNQFMKAKALLSLGQYKKAKSILNDLILQDPENPAVSTYLGILQFREGQQKEGLLRLQAAVEASPGVFENQWNYANALHNAEKYQEAAHAYRKAIAIQPFSQEAHYALGNVLYAMQDLQAAIQEYKEALRLGLRSALLHAALGAALADLRELDEARYYLQVAVETDPKLSSAWNKLGIIAEQEKRTREALELYSKALDAEPEYADALFNHAKVSLLLGDTRNSQRELEYLVKIHPDYYLGYYAQAQLYASVGDTNRAQAALKALLRFSKEADPKLVKKANEMLNSLDNRQRHRE